jgi:hypothetical protein
MSRTAGSMVRVSPDAGRALGMLAARPGERAALATRAVEWFLRQDEAVQVLVCGLLSQDALRLLAEDALKRLGRSAGESQTTPATLAAIRELNGDRPTTVRSVRLPASTQAKLQRHCAARCLDVSAVVSRLMVWVAEQSLLVRTVVLGRYPADLDRAVATVILRRAVHTPRRRKR